MLSGIGEQGKKTTFHLSHFFIFIAIDTQSFMGLESFKKTTDDIMRELRTATKAPGAECIYTAGEKEYLIWQEHKKTGLPVIESVQKELITIRDDAGLTDYHFSFER